MRRAPASPSQPAASNFRATTKTRLLLLPALALRRLPPPPQEVAETWAAGLAGGLYAGQWSLHGLGWLAVAISALLGFLAWMYRQECEPWAPDPVRAELERLRCDHGALLARARRLERELEEFGGEDRH